MNARKSQTIFILGLMIALGFMAFFLIDNNKPTVASFSPDVSITSPTPGEVIRASSVKVIVVASDDGSVASVEMWVQNDTFEGTHTFMTLTGSNWEAYLYFDGVLAGEYLLKAKAIDNEALWKTDTNTIYYRPIWEVSVSHDQVNYVSSDVRTDSLVDASVSIQNNATLGNLDLTLTLPSEFSDANNYELWHKNNEGTDAFYYTPSTGQPSEITTWYFNQFQLEETIYFTLKTPSITTDDRDVQFIDEARTTRSYTEKISVFSPHDFENIAVLYSPQIDVMTIWNWTIYRKVGVEKIDITESVNPQITYDFEIRMVDIQFSIANMQRGETFEFYIEGIEIPEEKANTGYFIVAVAFGAIGLIGMMVYGLTGDRGWSTGKILGFAVVGFVVGYLVGLPISYFLLKNIT